MALYSSVTYNDPPEELEQILREKYPQYYSEHDVTGGFICGEPGGLLVLRRMKQAAPLLRQFKVRNDDVFVRTFPKSGTTWTLEMVWLLQNNLDTEKAKQIIQEKRIPYFESESMISRADIETMATATNNLELKEGMADMIRLEDISQLPSPRTIKSHLPMYCLPPDTLDKCKVIYVARNPKDVIVSSYHFYNMQFGSKPMDFETYAQTFVDGHVIFAPYWAHVLESWNLRDHPNFLFLFYEDMKKDLRDEIRRVATFLNKTLTDEQVSAIAEHLSFRNMKQSGLVKKDKVFVDPRNNGPTFMRKGEVGDWVNHFSPELHAKVGKWIEENTRGTGLSFVDQL